MISIIIPTLNEESVIGDTIIKIRSKLTLPHEIIVSDGHSTDNTVAIAQQHADKVIAHDGSFRQTIAQGRNAGAQAATGEFLVFLDADCFIQDPDVFFTQALGRFREKNLVAYTTNIMVAPEFATRTDNIMMPLTNLSCRLQTNVFKNGAARGEFQMMKRETFEQLGGYQAHLVVGEDIDMYNRLSKAGAIWFDPELVVYDRGRRAHKIGWLRLIWLWTVNGLSVMVRGKSHSKEWTVVR